MVLERLEYNSLYQRVVLNGLKKGTDAENRVVDCKMLPIASDELVVGMPSVDLVVMVTMIETVLVTVMALAKHGTILFLAPQQLVIHFHFVLNFYSVTSQAVAQMLLVCPNEDK